MAKFTRNSEIPDPDVVFPRLEAFRQPTMLPTNGDVIGVMRGLMLSGDGKRMGAEEVLNKVTKMVYERYKHDTVYCVQFTVIKRRLKRNYEIVKEARKRLVNQSRGECKQEYLDLAKNSGKLFEVSDVSDVRAKECAKEFGVTMSKNEREYLEDQKTERRWWCSKKSLDPVWVRSQERKEREEVREAEWCNEKDNLFVEVEDSEVVVSEEESSNEVEVSQSVREEPCVSGKKKMKRKFIQGEENLQDEMPAKWRHIRTSEKKVKDEVYECIADLQGRGMSIQEAQHAVVRCSKLFGRTWKVLGEDEQSFDVDTLPHEKNMRTAMKQVEAKALSLVVDEILDSSKHDRMITHASDSTTKQRVGQFAVSGIHIGKNVPFPLPIIPICGETTNDIAEQAKLMFEILAAVKGSTAKELYTEMIDVHMTDSTEHNKGFAAVLAELLDLDDAKGQLFCGAHTTLGFSSAMNSRLSVIERHMTLEAIFNNFMVDLDFDTKHGSVAGQACDVILRLVAPEYAHKSWNYYEEFLSFLKKHEVSQVLFAYKDHRFGCLSRAAAVIVYLKPWLKQWLEENPNVTNRLACIVRDFLEIDYLDVALTCFAAAGLQLIEPFFSTTISEKSTHTSLQKFYKCLHQKMGEEVTMDFFNFKSPWFSVSSSIFNGVKESYNTNVVEAVEEMAMRYEDECVPLMNFFMEELRTVLARQRRDYGISDEFQPQYPVFEQATNVDDTPQHNLASERLCGKVDYRLKKLNQLEAVSRSIILEATGSLREDSDVSFRKFKKEAAAMDDLKLQWSSKMKKRFDQKLSEKEVAAAKQDEKRLNLLEELKRDGGPFTNSEEVVDFIKISSCEITSENDVKKKENLKKDLKKRMKNEMVFARDSSKCLPKKDLLFRIQVTLPNKKRRDKTPEEFAEALKVLLGKKADRSQVSLGTFKKSLGEVICFGRQIK